MSLLSYQIDSEGIPDTPVAYVACNNKDLELLVKVATQWGSLKIQIAPMR
jgi:hypothetical protein